MKKGCIVRAPGKLKRYMVQGAFDHGYRVIGVDREQGVGKVDALMGASPSFPKRR